jgi:uncharacterized RDD family membrane protein YckC
MAVQPPPTRQGPEAPAGPAPGMRFAGGGARLAAFIIDWIVMAIVFVLLLFLLGAIVVALLGSSGSEGAGPAVVGMALSVLAFAVFNVMYFPWSWSRGGQSIGMRLMAIKVVRDRDGGPVTFVAAVLRLLGYYLNHLTLLVGFAWILVDKRKRGWHDLLAGTCVVDA